MKIIKIQDTKNKLNIKIEGENHTFCNFLKNELLNIKGVSIASYNIKHPLIGTPEMIIETNGTITPKDALEKAIKNLKKQLSNLNKEIEKLN